MNHLPVNKSVPRPLFRYDDAGRIEVIPAAGALCAVTGSDLQAAVAFLQLYAQDAGTFRTYAKEVERFLLWCEYAAGLCLADVKQEHFGHYAAFLELPEPLLRWCTAPHPVTGKRPRCPRFTADGRVHPGWRPFAAPLVSTSVRKACVVVDRLFKQLVYQDYLRKHPLPPRRRPHNARVFVAGRMRDAIAPELIEAALTALGTLLEQAADPRPWVRARYVLLLFFYTGLRLREAATHRMSAFVQVAGQWFLELGVGDEARRVRVAPACMQGVEAYRVSLGLAPLPDASDATPLLPGPRRDRSVSVRRVDQILRDSLERAAAALAPHSPAQADQLRRVSAQALRRSYAQRLGEQGAPVHEIQVSLGHRSPQPTLELLAPVLSGTDTKPEPRDER
ncbi:MAG TPA: site-specific integrase [Acidiferrobacteraceae bacterium]|nr:site-specific integrase [Acidiferrobacteraceae bacterium]